MRVHNRTLGVEIAAEAHLCDTFASRLVGLMGRRDVGDGAVIEPCDSIHTCFMLAPIDAAFLDADDRVCALYAGLPPWRFTRRVPGARRVVEVAAGRLANTALGHQIERLPCG